MTRPREASYMCLRPWEAICSVTPREANCGCLSRDWILCYKVMGGQLCA